VLKGLAVTALELGGLAAIVAAAFLVHVALGLFVLGVSLFVIAYALERAR
jgi:cation transporter-like permease